MGFGEEEIGLDYSPACMRCVVSKLKLLHLEYSRALKINLTNLEQS